MTFEKNLHKKEKGNKRITTDFEYDAIAQYTHFTSDPYNFYLRGKNVNQAKNAWHKSLVSRRWRGENCIDIDSGKIKLTKEWRADYEHWKKRKIKNSKDMYEPRTHMGRLLLKHGGTIKKFCDTFRNVITKSKLNHNAIVYRGINIPSIEKLIKKPGGFWSFSSDLKGTVLKDVGYLDEKTKCCVLKLKLKRGDPAYVDMMEYQYVLSDGIEIVNLKRVKDVNGYKVFEIQIKFNITKKQSTRKNNIGRVLKVLNNYKSKKSKPKKPKKRKCKIKNC